MTFNSLYQLCLENAAVRSFSCLMLDLSFLTEELEKIQAEICPCDIHDTDGHGLEKEFHTTVLYGIHETKAAEVLPKLDLKPIKLRFGGISLFTNSEYDVLKFDINSKDLKALNKEVCEKFPHTNNFPVYHPHATIAYLQPGAGKHYTRLKNKLQNRQFTSNKFIFSDPNGSKVWFTTK